MVAAAPMASASSCYYPNCTAAKKAGECNIQQGSPHYCPQQDRCCASPRMTMMASSGLARIGA
jgi:hypothetical protein